MTVTGFIALYKETPIIESVRPDEDGAQEVIGNRFSIAYGEGWAIAEQLGYVIRPCVVMIEP